MRPYLQGEPGQSIAVCVSELRPHGECRLERGSEYPGSGGAVSGQRSVQRKRSLRIPRIYPWERQAPPRIYPRYLSDLPLPITIPQVAVHWNTTEAAAAQRLSRMVRAGVLRRVKLGTYTAT